MMLLRRCQRDGDAAEIRCLRLIARGAQRVRERYYFTSDARRARRKICAAAAT
jgi:hypothetical protein